VATVQALGHFAVMQKLRLSFANDKHGAEMVETVMLGILVPWTKSCTAMKGGRSTMRYTEDAKVIENFHTPKDLNKLAHDLFLELMTIHNAVCVEGGHKCTHTVMFKATSCIVGLLYVNALPSRSMELQSLPTSAIDEFLASSDDYFEIKMYKTLKYYGLVSTWVCKSNRTAFELYHNIRAKYLVDGTSSDGEEAAAIDDKLYFQPTPLYVHCHLRSISKAHKLEPQLKTNIMRKAFAVWAREKQAEDSVWINNSR